ncbi:hypothetical protein ACQJBY_037205 [Aegilops geniculata]
MQQMTVMSHLQSDNMAIPITSFTSFLTAGISSEFQHQAAEPSACNNGQQLKFQHQAAGPSAGNNGEHLNDWLQYSLPLDQEHEEEDDGNNNEEANVIESESDGEHEDDYDGNNEGEATCSETESDGEHKFDCNNDANEDYAECNSDQNETDAEDDYLEQIMLSSDQLLEKQQHSELQQLEQRWNHHDSVFEGQIITTDQQVRATSSEVALQGPDYAETTDTDGTSGTDDSEFEKEQKEEEEQETENYEVDGSGGFEQSNEQDQDESTGASGVEKMAGTNKEQNKVEDKLSQEDIEYFLENDSIEKAIKLSQEDEKKHMPSLGMTFESDAHAH